MVDADTLKVIVAALRPISSSLSGLAVPFFLFSLLVFLILLYFNWHHIRRAFSRIRGRTWLLLGAIVLLSLAIRLTVPERSQIMFNDEFEYLLASKGLLSDGSAPYYERIIGWPFILSSLFVMTGLDNEASMLFSMAAGVLTSITLFLLIYLISKREYVSLLASLLFALSSFPIRWSLSTETNSFSLFFVTLTMVIAFVYYEKGGRGLLWLSAFALAVNACIRPENSIFVVIFIIGCLLLGRGSKAMKWKEYVLPLLTIAVLCFPNVLSVTVFEFNLGADPDAELVKLPYRFGFDRVVANTQQFGLFAFDSNYQPLMLMALMVAGVAYLAVKGRRKLVFLLSWYLLLWLMFSFSPLDFLAFGSILKGARLFMSFYPITLAFVGFGIVGLIDVLKRSVLGRKAMVPILFAILVVIGVSMLFQVRFASSYLSDDAKLLITQVARQANEDIPADCVVLAKDPMHLGATGLFRVVSVEEFLWDWTGSESSREEIRKSGCLMYFEGYDCTQRPTEILGGPSCGEIRGELGKSYSVELHKSYSLGNVTYTFYLLK